MVLCWGKLDFLSVAAFVLHCSYITWRFYLTDVFSDRDLLNLHALFWLVLSEINIMLQTGINTLPSPRSLKELC